MIYKETKKLKDKIKINCNSSNLLIRVSNKFNKELEFINNKREEFGFDRLSKPKITELITKHKYWTNGIKSDLINFELNLEGEEDEE